MAEITAVETFLLFEVQDQPKDTFKVASFSGGEGISTLFRYDLDLVSPDHDLDFKSVIGKKAHLAIKGADADRHVNGLVSRIEHVGRSSEDLSRYRLALVPSVWVLGLRQNSRIFQELAVPDIIKKVLKDAAIPDDEIKIGLHGDHPKWDYCVQYRETDLAFIVRLMEQEGIFYFFQHDSGKTVMRMGDDPSDHPPAPDVGTLKLRAGSGMTVTEEVVTTFMVSEEVRPDKVVLRDYDFTKPTLDVTGSASDKPGLGTEVFDYPCEYEVPGEATAMAKIRLQELRATCRRGVGSTNCARLAPGHTFQIDGHPRKDHNGKYLIVEARHNGSQPQVLKEAGFEGQSGYGCSFTCIPASIPFRPARVTPRPSAQGAQTALVVGPAGEEIHTDEHGRIKVQFHWDRQGKKDEHSSCWIRVAQPWAGAQWGGLFIPRIGQEVIVEFLDGDPDQPIVTGAVYNGDNQPPYALPNGKTKSSLKSNSTIGGGGSNEIRFEDAKGSEEVFIHSQKDLTLVVENDESDTIRGNRKVSVGKDEDVTVGQNRKENVAKDESVTIGGSRSESVGKDETVSIAENRTQSIGKDEAIKIGAGRTSSVAKDDSEQIGASRTLTVGKTQKVDVSADATLKVGKNHGIDVGQAFVLKAGKEIALKAGGAELVLKSDGSIQLKGTNITIKGSGTVTVKGAKVETN
jgi:type VI secretion system secreted protein VgrG